MPKADDGVETTDPSAPAGGSIDAAAPQQDWKKLYEEETQKTAQWKESALKNKRLAKEAKIEPSNESEDERITRIATEAASRAVTVVTEDSLLNSKISDPEQRQLVKHYLENRIKRTGTSKEELEADIDFAINAASSQKIALENKELKRAQANDSRVAPAAGSNADRGVERKSHQWSLEEEKALDAKARALRVDPEKFKADAWKNRSRTSVA